LRHLLEAAGIEDLEFRLVRVALEDLRGDLRLELPRLELAVDRADAAVEIQSEAGHRVLVADVGLAEASRAHPPEVAPRLDEQDALPVLLRGVGGDDARGGTAVDEDVDLEVLRRRRRSEEEEQEGE